MKKRAVFIILIALIIIGAFGFWLWRDAIFSKEILKLEILAPKSAKAGEEIEYTVKYKNNGNFTLESPKLLFELPEYSQREDGKTRFTEELQDIYPGQEGFVKFSGVILGKEEDLKAARAWLSYTPKNLSARYESETSFITKIEQVPLTLDFDLLSKIEKGKEISYSVNYFSNMDYPLENISLKIEPVEGFFIKSSTPPSLDNSEWKLGTLNKSEGGKVSITGNYLAEPGSRLKFSAVLGKWLDGNFIVLKEAVKEIEVIEPLLFISQQINSSSSHVASSGETLLYEIFFRNIGSSSFDNLFAISRISGSAFDLSTLNSQEGQARPNDNLVIWDFKQIPRLKQLNPGQEVKVSFQVQLKDNWSISEAEKNNLFLVNKIDVLDISQEFKTKVDSKLELAQLLSSSGSENLHTVKWQIKNHFNDVRNVRVKATLPSNASLTSKIEPASQASNFSFDSGSGQIVWFVGDLPAKTGIEELPPEISFEISAAQSEFPGLEGGIEVSGEDQFTGRLIKKLFSP